MPHIPRDSQFPSIYKNLYNKNTSIMKILNISIDKEIPTDTIRLIIGTNLFSIAYLIFDW